MSDELMDTGQEIFPMGDEPDLTAEPVPQRETSLAPEKPEEKPQPEGPWWKQYENQEVEYTANGRAVKEPFAKVLERAQRGYNYAQHMEKLNADREALEQQTKDLQSKREWQELHDYSLKDPDWAQYVRDQFQRRNEWRQNAANDPAAQRILDLEAKLTPALEKLDKFEKAEQAREVEAANKALDAEIESVKAEYSKYGVDLASIDPATGLTMESTVYAYAKENGIRTFKAAFQACYGEKIWGMREEALKKQWAEEQSKRQKAGFIGRTPTPTQGPKKVQNAASRSWDDIGEEAKSAIRAGHY